MPGWPLFAAWTASIARARIALASSLSSAAIGLPWEKGSGALPARAPLSALARASTAPGSVLGRERRAVRPAAPEPDLAAQEREGEQPQRQPAIGAEPGGDALEQPAARRRKGVHP